MADVSAERIATVKLKRGCAKPLHAGHPWVFADALAGIDGPNPQPGDEVRVVDDSGAFLGRGFISPKSAIAVRLLTRADAPITSATLSARIDEALRLRRDILRLGVAQPPSAGERTGEAPVPLPALDAKDQAMLDALDQQLERIRIFAAQYEMDPMEETAELRKRRDILLKSAGVDPASVAQPPSTGNRTACGPAALGWAQARAPVPPLTTAYRLINSEGDGLGGLTVDVYGEYLTVQVGTAGMERRLTEILDALEERLHPEGILDRSDARTRQIEKLEPPRSGPLRGQEPSEVFFVQENGVEMICDLRAGRGQKTGLFLDQRENRKRFGQLTAGRRVLDVFCYTAGFALHALKAGAKEAVLLDSSADALELAARNLEHSGLKASEALQAEWPEGFKRLREAGRQFDAIVLDPPKFAPSREHLSRALSAYRDLNTQAVRLLAPDGLLFTCSCSGAVSELDFERTVAAGLRSSGRRALLLEHRSAGPDHPIPPGFDQGKYLKCLVLQVV